METSKLACEQATSNRIEERQILVSTPVTCKSSLKLQCKVISDRLFGPVPVRLPRSSAVKSCLLLLLFLIICLLLIPYQGIRPKTRRKGKAYRSPANPEDSTPKSPSPDQEPKKATNPEDQAAKDTPNPLSEPENPTQAFWWKNRKKVIFQRPFTDEED